MVKKLLKHELIALFRVAYIPAIVVIVLAVLFRISLEANSEEAASLMVTLGFFYLFALLGCNFVCWGMGVQRFYKSFFSGEGYMTLSLPVTASQLIWSKLISALVVMLFSAVSCILSALIFFIGLPADFYEVMSQIFGELGQMISMAFQQDPMLFVEMIIQSIVMIPAGFLVFYLVISLAQLFTTKNRKGMAVLIYLGGMFVIGIIGSLVIGPLTELMTSVSYHLTMWMGILFYAAVDVACFFIVRYILTHKVNMTA